MMRVFLVAVSAFLLVFTTTTCKKLDTSLIVGSWEHEYSLMHVTEPHPRIWRFYDNGELEIVNETIYQYYTSPATYKIVRLDRKNYIDIDDSNKKLSGRWLIFKLDSKVLIIQRVELPERKTAGAFLRREFNKLSE